MNGKDPNPPPQSFLLRSIETPETPKLKGRQEPLLAQGLEVGFLAYGEPDLAGDL
jgi:hypothetical protein